jgi:uncharacterized membrane protein YgdD (TMEM256/DUF423 family)
VASEQIALSISGQQHKAMPVRLMMWAVGASYWFIHALHKLILKLNDEVRQISRDSRVDVLQ